jgi:transcriptional regulator with XRE-family HTH domain
VDDALTDPWQPQRAALGAFIRTERQLSNLSLRELSRLTRISNAYLSQVERGLHDPTLRVLSQIGEAL